LAGERVRWGYRRLHVLLRREGQKVNIKRVYRLYREEGLAVRRRKRKRVAVARAPQPAPTRLNERWAMDFMSDVLVGGRRYRIFNVLERLSREALASEVDTSLPALRVIRVLEEIALERGYPTGIVVDNGTEFRSTALDAWGLRARRHARVHPTGQADPERGGGELQRSDAGRTLEPALVAHPRRGSASGRRVSGGL
jgi:putative transposase